MSLLYEVATDKNSRFLRPSGGSGGNVDVVNDFAWTKSPKSARSDTSYAHLVEYQQTTGQLMASILYYSRIVGNASSGGAGSILAPKDPSDVFKFKYIAEPTGFSYRFPYFSQQKHSRSTNFSGENTESPFKAAIDFGKQIVSYGTDRSHGIFDSAIGGIFGKLSTTVELGVLAANTYFPGKINFELPQKWSGTDESSFSIKFHLFNTGTVDDIENNRNLAYILTYQNSANRRNFALVDPVVIYSLYIPDTVNFPACYMDSLVINNIGNTRTLTSSYGKPRIIPEAYEFNMTFRSLMMPTRNVMEQLDKGETVQAINDVNGLNELIAAQQKLSNISSLDNVGRANAASNFNNQSKIFNQNNPDLPFVAPAVSTVGSLFTP